MQQSFSRTLPKFFKLGFLLPLFTQGIEEQNGCTPLFNILHDCVWKELTLKSGYIMFVLFKLYRYVIDAWNHKVSLELY